jgi:hypothetical protein
MTDSCKCHGGLVENVEFAGMRNESAIEKNESTICFYKSATKNYESVQKYEADS